MTSALKRSHRRPTQYLFRFMLLAMAILVKPNVVHADESGRYIQSGLERVASSITVLAIAISSAGFVIAIAIYASSGSGRSETDDGDPE